MHHDQGFDVKEWIHAPGSGHTLWPKAVTAWERLTRRLHTFCRERRARQYWEDRPSLEQQLRAQTKLGERWTPNPEVHNYYEREARRFQAREGWQQLAVALRSWVRRRQAAGLPERFHRPTHRIQQDLQRWRHLLIHGAEASTRVHPGVPPRTPRTRDQTTVLGIPVELLQSPTQLHWTPQRGLQRWYLVWHLRRTGVRIRADTASPRSDHTEETGAAQRGSTSCPPTFRGRDNLG